MTEATTTAPRTDPRLEQLRVPFRPEQVGKLPKGGTSLDYVGHADVTDRLLDVDPAWTWEPVAFGPDGLPALDPNGGLWIRLTVCGVTRLGYGHADGRKGGDAIKVAIGDALRNAAMRFGVALDLWAKGDRAFGQHPEDVQAAPAYTPDQHQALSAISALTPEDKASLRDWCQAEAIGAVVHTWDAATCERVVARARQLAAR